VLSNYLLLLTERSCDRSKIQKVKLKCQGDSGTMREKDSRRFHVLKPMCSTNWLEDTESGMMGKILS